jgi:hypothetical protein
MFRAANSPDTLTPMTTRETVRTLLVAAVLLGLSRTAAAQQPFESVGIRALGMGGAFVAVADDASAVYWNPAGLATGGPVGATIEWTKLRSGNLGGLPQPGDAGQSSSLVSLGSWPVGLFYGKIRSTELIPAGPGVTNLETFETRQFGATILQSLAHGVVLGSSLKYVRGGLTSGQSTAATTGEIINDGLNLSGSTNGAFDLDVGLMVDLERVRLGLTARNLRQPVFVDDAGNATTLKRQSRAGISVKATDGLTLAMDVDLDTVDLRGGLRRMIAFGGESRLSPRLAIRGGVRWNLEVDGGVRRPVAAAGASVQIRPKFYVDGFYTQGRAGEDRGFGFGLRAGS